MKVCRDIKKNKVKIIGSINKFGFSPEHNYYHYIYKQTPYKRCVFFDFGRKRGLMAMFNEKSSVWYVPTEALAPAGERLGIFLEFLNYAIGKKKAKKAVVECGKDFKSVLFNRLKGSKYKLRINYTLHWPVYDIESWDGQLKGKQWKKFRNIRNRFCNRSQVEFKNPRKISESILKSILFSWHKRRYSRDRVDLGYYLNIIDGNFRGFESARALSINGEPCSISAGWKIPNSNNFYYAVGIFNYKHKYLGDFINLDDLIHIKKIGYRHVDLGGSDKALLSFKSKFKPKTIYKTYVFSIFRKQ